jgi:hypothetical protein
VLDPVTDGQVQAAGEELVEVLRLTSPGVAVAMRMMGRA